MKNPGFGKMPLTASSFTEWTRSKLAPTVDPLVTLESEEKSKSGNKVKKKEDCKSPSNAERRADTLKYKKDTLTRTLADKEEASKRESLVKVTADRESKTLEDATMEKEQIKKKHRSQKTKDKDRKKKGLTDDVENSDNGAVPLFGDAMPDANNDNDEWKRVDKRGNGKTKKLKHLKSLPLYSNKK